MEMRCALNVLVSMMSAPDSRYLVWISSMILGFVMHLSRTVRTKGRRDKKSHLQQIVVSFEQLRMVLKAVPFEIFFFQLVRLDHGPLGCTGEKKQEKKKKKKNKKKKKKANKST
jgi:hypothetical protein